MPASTVLLAIISHDPVSTQSVSNSGSKRRRKKKKKKKK